MENFLKAAAIAWNPIGQVRQRLDSDTLTVSTILIPAVAATIACTLLRVEAWDFFWNTVLHAANQNVPKLTTSTFVVKLGSAVGSLVVVASLALLPPCVFQPYGRSAVAAALLIVLVANAFYFAAIAVPVYFVAGSVAFGNLRLGIAIFQSLSLPMALVVMGLTLYFWCRISLSVLNLGAARMIGISLVVAFGFATIFGLVQLLASASSSAAGE